METTAKAPWFMALDSVRVYGDAVGAWHLRLTAQDRVAFDRYLVAIRHPLAYEAGTGQDRFGRWAREQIANQGGWDRTGG